MNDEERSKKNFDIFADGLTLEELETALSLVEEGSEWAAKEGLAKPTKPKDKTKPDIFDFLSDIEIPH